MDIQSINPYDQSVLAILTADTEQECAQKITHASQTQQSWKLVSVADKAILIRHLANQVKQQADRLAMLATTEMGKPLAEAKSEVLKCVTVCEYYATYAAQFLATEEILTEHEQSMVRHEPLGVVLGIMPWNFPFWQVFRFAVPAIMAGNTALLKHASNVPQCAKSIEELFVQAGFPVGVFTTLLIQAEQVQHVIQHEEVKAISLTGSEEAGMQVAEQAGKVLKKVVLELGGSDPFIVLKDADIAKVAKQAVAARMQNNGQSCIAAKRFIVEQAVVEDFTNAVLAQIQALQVGNPMDAEVQIGPLAKVHFAEVLDKQVQTSMLMGARLMCGGTYAGAMFQPTLLTQVTTEMPVFKEETFGPVLVIIQATDWKEAVALANQTPYGLGASLWTSDLNLAQQIEPQIQAGAVFVNTMVKSDARLPFGGVKKSGFGRELSKQGLLEFTNTKTVVINPL